MRQPSKSAPPTIRRRDLDAIFEDLNSHFVPKDYCRVSAPIQSTYADAYIAWFYRVSHSIMTLYAPRRPHMPYNQETLEARGNVCQCIVDMVRSGIEVGLFEEESV